MDNAVRKMAVSGTFYPGDKDELIGLIKRFERSNIKMIDEIDSDLTDKDVKGLIVPHAGWVYSGNTAAIAYHLLRYKKPAKIALLGLSHQYRIQNVIADNHNYWDSPLGDIEIVRDDHFETENTIHSIEHSLEVQVPFIRYYSKTSSLLPLVVGELNADQARACAAHLLSNDYFLIISTDLSHFNSLAEAQKIDMKTIESVKNLDHHNLDACGRNPLKVAFEYCKLIGSRPRLIDYSTSAETSGDASRVVGYASFYF